MNLEIISPSIAWPAAALVSGIVATAIGTRFLLARRHRFEIDRHLKRQQEISAEAQQLRNQLNIFRTTLDSNQSELRDLRQLLLKETERRAGFQQQASRASELETALSRSLDVQIQLRERISLLKEELAAVQKQIEYERQGSEEKQQALTQVHQNLRNGFQSLAADALQANNQLFLDLARGTLEKLQLQAQTDLRERQKSVADLITPLQQALLRYEQEVKQIERERQQAYTKLTTQAELLNVAQSQLQSETTKLVKALGQPQVRGRWGEITLQRVVELAGMTEHCDFQLQAQVENDGARLRPDMVVHLPAERIIAIDSKVPLKAYLEAMDCHNDDDRNRRLREHGKRIRNHMQQLSSKQYWSQFAQSPEFVVLFLPGESFFSAALEQDPELIEYGVNQKVILATPTTLIALLKSVAYGWQQRNMVENTRAISERGKELNTRLISMVGHFQELGKQLRRSVQQYNQAMGTFEKRVLVSARKLAALGASPGDDIAATDQVDDRPRLLSVSEQEQDPQRSDEGITHAK